MMATLFRLFDQGVCIHLTETLLHFLWQGLVIGLVAAIAAWRCRNARCLRRFLTIYSTPGSTSVTDRCAGHLLTSSPTWNAGVI